MAVYVYHFMVVCHPGTAHNYLQRLFNMASSLRAPGATRSEGNSSFLDMSLISGYVTNFWRKIHDSNKYKEYKDGYLSKKRGFRCNVTRLDREHIERDGHNLGHFGDKTLSDYNPRLITIHHELTTLIRQCDYPPPYDREDTSPCAVVCNFLHYMYESCRIAIRGDSVNTEIQKILYEFDVQKPEDLKPWTAFFMSALIFSGIELPEFVQDCFGIKEGRTYADFLQMGDWNFAFITIVTILPLYVSLFSTMFFDAEYRYNECLNSTLQGVDVYPTNTFTAMCNPPMVMTKPEYHYPHSPVVTDSNGDCLGMANGIENYIDRPFPTDILKFVVFILLGLFSKYLNVLETTEKMYVCVALHLNGIFFPCEERWKMLPRTSIFRQGPKDSEYNFIWLIYVKDFIQERFVFLLFILYFVSFVSQTDVFQTYYIVPDSSITITGVDSESQLRDQTYQNMFSCNLLKDPIILTYVNRQNKDYMIMSFIEVWMFLSMCFSLKNGQKDLYDWIDPDKLLDERCNQNQYYNIHKNRLSNFNEPMINDWIACNVLPILARKKLDDNKDEKQPDEVTKNMHKERKDKDGNTLDPPKLYDQIERKWKELTNLQEAYIDDIKEEEKFTGTSFKEFICGKTQ